MKDDVFSLKQPCQIETENLLYFSQDLSQYGKKMGPEETIAADSYIGWQTIGCPPIEDLDNPGFPCLSVTTYESTSLPGEVGPCGFVDDDQTGEWTAIECRMKFSRIKDDPYSDPMGSSDGRVAQVLQWLPRGTYLLTWFDKSSYPPPIDIALISDYSVVLESRDATGAWNVDSSTDFTETYSWKPKGIVFRVATESDVRIGIDPSAEGYHPASIDIAAMQLLRIDDPDSWSTYCGTSSASGTSLPACVIGNVLDSGIILQRFEPTGSSRLEPSMCSDQDGQTFRQMFSYKCDFLCADGFSEIPCDSSDDGAYPVRCYYELPFHISLEEVESGDTFTSGSIAVGNFNYRHYLLGLNVIGTNVIDCTEAEFPSTCYSNGFLQFSLMHSGNFTIRNHYGDTVRYNLPNAWLEHQKALTAEVVLTNPPNGSQMELMNEYMNAELWGRPLTGEYLLRIWDVDGLVWDNVEDVQMALDYHYWTRHTY